jgi:hypothetical protein
MRKSLQYILWGQGDSSRSRRGGATAHVTERDSKRAQKSNPELPEYCRWVIHCIHLTAVDFGEIQLHILLLLNTGHKNCMARVRFHFWQRYVEKHQMLVKNIALIFWNCCANVIVSNCKGAIAFGTFENLYEAPSDLTKHSFTWWSIEDFVASETGRQEMWGTNVIKSFTSITLLTTHLSDKSRTEYAFTWPNLTSLLT